MKNNVLHCILSYLVCYVQIILPFFHFVSQFNLKTSGLLKCVNIYRPKPLT